MLLEQPEDNPFLHRFYDDMPRFALPTQLTFLFQRVDQLRRLAQKIGGASARMSVPQSATTPGNP